MSSKSRDKSGRFVKGGNEVSEANVRLLEGKKRALIDAQTDNLLALLDLQRKSLIEKVEKKEVPKHLKKKDKKKDKKVKKADLARCEELSRLILVSVETLQNFVELPAEPEAPSAPPLGTEELKTEPEA